MYYGQVALKIVGRLDVDRKSRFQTYRAWREHELEAWMKA